MKRLLATGGILAGLSPAVVAGPVAAPARGPSVTAGGYRVTVERVAQSQSLMFEFDEQLPGGPAPAGGRAWGRQSISLAIAVVPARPELLARIEGLDTRLLGFTPAGRVVTLRWYPPDEEGPASLGAWRASLGGEDLELSVTRLARVEGELLIAPQARKISLEIPLGEGETERRTQGIRALVRPMPVRHAASGLFVELDWDPDLRLARSGAEARDLVTVLGRSGTPLVPDQMEVAASRRAGRPVRGVTLGFSGADPPASVRVTAVARSGAPVRVPFTLREVPLPAAMNPESAGREGGTAAPLARAHPFFHAQGGRLAIRVARGGRQLVVGLAPQGTPAPGPWRWFSAPADDRGEALLRDLKPGAYRVLVHDPETGRGQAASVTLAAGRTVVLAMPAEVIP